jgi:hypothetical protein
VARLAESPERFRSTDIQVTGSANVFAKAMLPTVLALVGNVLAICYMFKAGWTALTVLFLFWVESVTLAVVTLGRMMAALPGYHRVPGRTVKYARGGKDVNESWSSLEPSIASLFSMFAMYGVFVAMSAFIGAHSVGSDSWRALCRSLSSVREQPGGVVLILLLNLGQQAVSAYLDFVRGPDWARHDPLFQTRGLLGRGIGLYSLVLLAVFVVDTFHWPRGFLVIFIVFKTAVDIIAINFNARVQGDWQRSYTGKAGEPERGQLSGSSAGRK